MREATLKDWIILIALSGLLGGVLGLFFDPRTTILFWIIDIPALLWLNWWFLWREESTTERCAQFMCKNEPLEDDSYCETHNI